MKKTKQNILAVAFLSLYIIPLFGQIGVVSNFEGGNGVLLESGIDNYVKVGSELKLGDTRNYNFFCQITGLNPSVPLQFELDAEFVGQQIVYSYDNISWTRTNDRVNGQFTIPLQGPEIYLSHFKPYLYSELEIYLADLDAQNLDFVEIKTLATSELGTAVKHVTFTDPCIDNSQKKVIWVLGRQHAAEVPASFVIEGMMDAFSLDSDQMKRLRKETVIHVVPMMDVDMCIEGGTGKDQNPVDFNRDWTAPDYTSHWSAVNMVKKIMDEMPNEISLFMDMHTFAPGEPANVHISLQIGDHLLYTQNYIEHTAINGGLDYAITPWTNLNLDVSQDYIYEFHANANLLSITPETAFELAPDNTFWTPEKLIEQGKAFGTACSDYIHGLNQAIEEIVDNNSMDIELAGNWINSTNYPGYFGTDYLYADPNTESTCTFTLIPDEDGLYGISTHYSSDQSRANNVSYQLTHNNITRDYVIDQTVLGSRWRNIDTISLKAGVPLRLTLNASDANGFVIADAARIYPLKTCMTSSNDFSAEFNHPHLKCFPNPTRQEFSVQLPASVMSKKWLLDRRKYCRLDRCLLYW